MIEEARKLFNEIEEAKSKIKTIHTDGLNRNQIETARHLNGFLNQSVLEKTLLLKDMLIDCENLTATSKRNSSIEILSFFQNYCESFFANHNFLKPKKFNFGDFIIFTGEVHQILRDSSVDISTNVFFKDVEVSDVAELKSVVDSLFVNHQAIVKELIAIQLIKHVDEILKGEFIVYSNDKNFIEAINKNKIFPQKDVVGKPEVKAIEVVVEENNKKTYKNKKKE
jgi:hypothetical protein